MSIPDKDYSNTIIYKITCKDPNIHDVYVGHTVNFVQRKKAHQLSCMKSSSPAHNCKVYKVIRNNGGWDNWTMDIIAFYKCKDLSEARQKEQEHFVELNATLNSVEPFPSKPVRTIRIIKPVRRVRPVRPVRQNKSTYNENMPISAFNRPNVCYSCEPCHFKTDNKTDYERHLTRKNISKTHNTANKRHPSQTLINARLVISYSNIARVFTSISLDVSQFLLNHLSLLYHPPRFPIFQLFPTQLPPPAFFPPPYPFQQPHLKSIYVNSPITSQTR